MAANHNDYRVGYDVESGQHRFPVQSSETTYRPILFGTLAVMGLLQVASSVAILLHLTGYLQEVGSLSFHRPTNAAPRFAYFFFFTIGLLEGGVLTCMCCMLTVPSWSYIIATTNGLNGGSTIFLPQCVAFFFYFFLLIN